MHPCSSQMQGIYKIDRLSNKILIMKKYSVVGFITDDGEPVEVIPTEWLVDDSTCLWPSKIDKRTIKNLILKCTPPDDSWEKYSIKIYGKSNSIVTAKKKAVKAQELSSIGSDSSEDEKLKRRPKLPIRFRETFFTDDEESQDLLEDRAKKSHKKYELPKPPSDNYKIIDNTENENFSHGIVEVVPDTAATSVQNVKTSNLHVNFAQSQQLGQGSSFSNFLEESATPQQETTLEKILKYLIELKLDNRNMKKEIKKLQEKIDMLLTARANSTAIAAINEIAEVEEFGNLPLSNISDLMNLESQITTDAGKATCLARFLCRGGGYNNANSLVCIIIKRLLARSVAMQFSLEGRQGKMKFCDLNLFNVVIASVKMKFEETETSAISSRIARVLSGSIDWDGNRSKRKRKRCQDECTVNDDDGLRI